MSDVTSEDLEEFDDDFGGASGESTNAYTPVKDGNYTVDVEAVELKRTKDTNRPMLAWKLRIVGPSSAGRVLYRNSVISTGKGMEFMKKDLYLCGLAIEKLSDLPANLEKLLDLRIKIRKVTKGEFENFYFQELVKTDTAPVDSEFFAGVDVAPPTPDDDDFPF